MEKIKVFIKIYFGKKIAQIKNLTFFTKNIKKKYGDDDDFRNYDKFRMMEKKFKIKKFFL